MRLVLKQHVLAKRDIQQQVEYYVHQSGLILADCFVQSVQESFEYLSEFPTSGSLFQTRIARLQDIRCWCIKQFPKHVIFYRMSGDALLVLRVVHGARQVVALLKELN